MYVEFKTVIVDWVEQHKKALDVEALGESSVPWENESDKIVNLVLDVTSIVGWNEGTVQVNNSFRKCIYAYIINDSVPDYTKALLISHEDFKAIWEEANRTKIVTASSLITKGGIV